MSQSREELLIREFPFEKVSLKSYPDAFLGKLPFSQIKILPKLIKYCQLQNRDPALIKRLEVGFCNGIAVVALNAIAQTLADRGGNNLHWFLHCARIIEQLDDEKIKKLSAADQKQIESFLGLIESFQNTDQYEAVSQGELQTSLSSAGQQYQQVGTLAGAFTPSDFLKTIDLTKVADKKSSPEKERKHDKMPAKASMLDLIAQEKCIALVISHNHATGFLTTQQYFYYFDANQGLYRIPRDQKSALITLLNVAHYSKTLNEYLWSTTSCPFAFNIVSQQHLDHPLSHSDVVRSIINRTDTVEKDTLKTEEFKHADQYTPLHMAAWEGDTVSLAAWLEQYKKAGKLKEALNKKYARNMGRSVEDEYKDKEKEKEDKTANPATPKIIENTPLSLAAQRGHTQFVAEYLKNLGDIDPTEINYAFFAAMQHQFLDVAALLVPYVPYDINYQLIANIYTKQNNLPLILAAKLNHMPLAQALIIQNATPIQQNPGDENTALHIALKQGNVEMFYLLFENMPKTKHNLNIANKDGETLLHIAAEKGLEAIMDSILKIDPTLIFKKDKAGNTPLHTLAKSSNVKLIDRLATEAKGLDFNIPNRAGERPVHIAAQFGNNEMIKTLIKHGAINIPDEEGNSLLHLAARHGKVNTMKMLIDDFKADLESKNSQGQTPLFLAVLKGKDQAAKDLIASKAATNLTDNAGNSPLHLLSKNSPEFIKKMVTEYKLDINQKNKLGETPLSIYIKESKNDLLKALLEHGKFDLNAADQNKLTPLHHASKSGNVEAAKLLIQKGANINIEDEKGQSLASQEFKANRHELFKAWLERRLRDDFLIVADSEAEVIAGWVKKGLIQTSDLARKEIILHNGTPLMTWLKSHEENKVTTPTVVAPSSVSIFPATPVTEKKSEPDLTKSIVSEQELKTLGKHIDRLKRIPGALKLDAFKINPQGVSDLSIIMGDQRTGTAAKYYALVKALYNDLDMTKYKTDERKQPSSTSSTSGLFPPKIAVDEKELKTLLAEISAILKQIHAKHPEFNLDIKRLEIAAATVKPTRS
ncbi:MAG: ankyrin repeat domain-containing protein [Gammaproteobacteria bacterium]